MANSLETAAESGRINYTPTYLYAIDSETNACLDADGDGISDVVDLDDDNDGVLDITECPEVGPYRVYTYNRTSTDWSSNVPVTVAGRFSSTIALNQNGTFTDLT